MHLWDKSINLDCDYVEKYHSSAGDICTIFFYLNINKHDELVIICNLLFEERLHLAYWNNYLNLIKSFWLDL